MPLFREQPRVLRALVRCTLSPTAASSLRKFRSSLSDARFASCLMTGMRLPSSPDEPHRPRDPSYPDRARILSDVREFMRQPSTPWIVFDRDSRVPREELAKEPTVVASTPMQAAMFPADLAHAPTEPVIEPS